MQLEMGIETATHKTRGKRLEGDFHFNSFIIKPVLNYRLFPIYRAFLESGQTHIYLE